MNWLKSNGSKIADKSNLTKPWSSICKLNNIPRGTRTVPRHYEKTKEWVVPQLLEWSSHSLAYEITQLRKTNHTTLHGCSTCPLPWPTTCGVCFSLNLNKSTSYLFLCLSLNFLQWDIKNLSFIRSWNQVPWFFAGFEFQPHGFKSQARFWLGLSPGHMGSSPKQGFG